MQTSTNLRYRGEVYMQKDKRCHLILAAIYWYSLAASDPLSNHATLQCHFPHLNVGFILKSNKLFSNFFSFKDRVPGALRLSAVYFFKCMTNFWAQSL